ncbi:serine hydrolase domain-containing protein [Saccharopolyspora shandongensis]|uniref:serine hydrolase domain-containing protein n=1 Tax=Saccharopolyspora shandongensis TaxID=418495 RepID=UPI0033F42AA3
MTLQQLLDRIVADEGIPGIIAEVRREDGSTWFGTAGVADIETEKPRRREEHFRIGSATKTFTSTITLQLAAEGRLSLDDSVETWLPGLVRGNGNDGNAISIRQLLAHTSGLYLYSMAPELVAATTGPAFLEHRYDRCRPEDLVEIAVSHPPAFAPGTQWRYNNTGYILAGMIVERITGRSFADELQQRIAGPLDLTHTYLPGDETTIRDPHARHYTTALLTEPDSPVYDATELHPSPAWTAGGMVSSLKDLNRFFSLLFGGRLLPPEQQQELLTTTSTEGAGWLPNTRYGLGIYTETTPSGVDVWGNGGAITGSWTISLGTKDGRHRLTANLNGDWGNLLGAFSRLAETEFVP